MCLRKYLKYFHNDMFYFETKPKEKVCESWLTQTLVFPLWFQLLAGYVFSSLLVFISFFPPFCYQLLGHSHLTYRTPYPYNQIKASLRNYLCSTSDTVLEKGGKTEA